MSTAVAPAAKKPATKKIMSRQDYEQHAKVRYEDFDIEDYGTVRIRSLNEKEGSDFERKMLNSKCEVDPRRAVEARRRLIILTQVDGNNRRIFSDTRDDYEFLESMDRRITGLIAEAAQKHTGIKIDQDAITKNSEETSAAASS